MGQRSASESLTDENQILAQLNDLRAALRGLTTPAAIEEAVAPHLRALLNAEACDLLTGRDAAPEGRDAGAGPWTVRSGSSGETQLMAYVRRDADPPLILRWRIGDGIGPVERMVAQAAAHIIGAHLTAIHANPRRETPASISSEPDRRLRLFDLLSDLTLGIGALDADAFLQSAVSRIATLLGADNCFITRWDPDLNQVSPVAAFGPDSSYFNDVSNYTGKSSVTERVLASGRPLAIRNVRNSPVVGQPVDEHAKTQSVLAFPLLTQRRKLGVLFLTSHEIRTYDEEDFVEVERIARLLSLALANVELFEDTRRQLEELSLLHQIAEAGTRFTDEDAFIAYVTDLVGSTIYSDNFGILILSADGKHLVPHPSYVARVPNAVTPQLSIPIGEGITGRVAATGRSILLRDVRQHRAFLRIDPDTRSELCVPLRVGDETLGVINAESHTLNGFNDEDERLLSTLASQIAVAIQQLRLLARAEQRSTDTEALVRFVMHLRAVNSIRETTTRLLPRVLTLARASAVRLFLIDPKNNQITSHVAGAGEPPEEVTQMMDLDLVNYVISSNAPYVTENLAGDPIAALATDGEASGDLLRSAAVLPLRSQGWIVGVLCIYRREPIPFSPPDMDRLLRMADIIGSVLDRALVLESLERRVADRTRELEEANRRLQELDRLKSKFVSDVSHELRTPVTSLRLYLDLLRHGNAAKRERYLEMMHLQTERLSTLIEDTLSLSRIDLAGITVEMQPLQLDDVVRDVVEALRPQAEAAGLRYMFHPGEPPLVRGEPNQLAQVVTNLISNGLQYTPAGFVHVSTGFDPDSDRIWLSVSDSGMGIPDGDRPHLFERFYRGVDISQSTIPGSGLGLAIVAEVLQLHGGQIEVDSEVGEGSTFTVYLKPYTE